MHITQHFDHHLSCIDFSNTLRNCPKKVIFSLCISYSFCNFFSSFSSFLSTNSLNRETNSLLSLGGFFRGFFFFISSSSQSSIPVPSESSTSLPVEHSGVCLPFRLTRPFLLLYTAVGVILSSAWNISWSSS